MPFPTRGRAAFAAFAVSIALAALLAVPATGAAAVKHVAPTGSGTACTVAAPCGLYPALNAAANGDEVVVAPGDYGSVATPLTTDGQFYQANLYVHGVAGQPRPRIFTTHHYPFAFSGGGVRVEHLHLEGLGNADYAQYLLRLSGAAGSVADDVVAHVRSPNGDVACSIGGTQTIRNSLCWDSGPGTFGAALDQFAALDGAINGTVRNATLISDHGIAARNQSSPGGGGSDPPRPALMTVVNSIVRGGAYDVYQQKFTAAASITTTRVNRRGTAGSVAAGGGTVTLDPNDQFAAPAFVNAAAGDFGQTAVSPTRDAGIDDAANGPFGFGGIVPRRVGSATDIGADELTTAPAVSTADPVASSATAAQLPGTVNPNGVATAWRAQYGTTTAYGAQTAEATISVGAAAVAVSSALTGLAPSTTYHVRLVATSARGTTAGVDRTFTTPAVPADVGGGGGATGAVGPVVPVTPVTPVVPGGPAQAGPAPTLSGLSLSPRRVRAGRGTHLSLRLSAAATVRITLLRGSAGRRQGSACRKATSTNRKAKRCTRYVAVRTLSRTLPGGATRLTLSKAVLGRRTGSYRLSLVADAGGRRSPAVTVGLRIVKR